MTRLVTLLTMFIFSLKAFAVQNGKDATPQDTPNSVVFFEANWDENNKPKTQCTAAKISKNLFITAAHCISFFDYLPAEGVPIKLSQKSHDSTWRSFNNKYLQNGSTLARLKRVYSPDHFKSHGYDHPLFELKFIWEYNKQPISKIYPYPPDNPNWKNLIKKYSKYRAHDIAIMEIESSQLNGSLNDLYTITDVDFTPLIVDETVFIAGAGYTKKLTGEGFVRFAEKRYSGFGENLNLFGTPDLGILLNSEKFPGTGRPKDSGGAVYKKNGPNQFLLVGVIVKGRPKIGTGFIRLSEFQEFITDTLNGAREPDL